VQPATYKVAGFVLWERESEQEGKEVKKSEAYTCNAHVNALFGSGVGSHNWRGVSGGAKV